MILESLFGNREKPLEPVKTSPGKLRAYQQCPLKYRLVYVDGRQLEQKPSPHLAFDSILNRMIESFQKKSLASKIESVEESLIQELDAVWNPSDFPDPEERLIFQDAARIAAGNMARWFRSSTGQVVQYQNKPGIGMFAPWYPRPITIWTRLDRVEQMPDGSIRIIDFKSGAREVTAAEMRMDLGIRLQAMAGRELFGQAVGSIALVYMRSGNTVEVPCDELELDLLQADVREIVQSMQAKRFEPNLGPLCSVCEFQVECSGWQKKLPWELVKENRDQYRERLRLSYSKMSLYERCPRAYKALYHQRIAPKPQPFFSFGSCIHSVMEEFYDPASREKPTLDRMMMLLEERWRFFRVGYRTVDEEDRYFNQARSMLEKFYNRFVREQKFRPASYIEKYFELPVANNSVMTGFIDRIDMLPGGGAIVLDYKTEPTDRSQEAVDKDLQLTLYYWAAREFLRLDIRELGLFMMSHDKLMITTRSPDDVPELLQRISDVTQRIRSDTEFAPRINKYCLNCDHLSGCPLEDQIRGDATLHLMDFTDEDVAAEDAGNEG